MDPLYATSDPNQLYMTDSGFAMAYDPSTDPALVAPAIYSPAPTGQDFGTMLGGALTTFAQNFQRLLSPTAYGVPPTGAVAPGINLGSPTTLLLIGVGAYLLLRKR